MRKENTFVRFLLTALVSLMFLGSAAAEELQVLYEKTFDTTPGKLLKVETQTGSVKIETWDKNEVYVKVLGDQKAKEKLEFRFDREDWGVFIGTKRKDGFWGFNFNWGRSPKLRFEIMVPKSYNTKVSTSGGNIGVKDLAGSIEGKTSGGDIKLFGNTGNANTSTSGGDIIFKNHKGNTKASTSGGDVSVADFYGDLDVATSGGDVKLDYWGDNLGIDLSTSGGDITVYLPADFSAKANLKTSGGSISCELTTNNVVKISSSRFEADLNKGGKNFTCHTSGGDIEVKRK